MINYNHVVGYNCDNLEDNNCDNLVDYNCDEVVGYNAQWEERTGHVVLEILATQVNLRCLKMVPMNFSCPKT